MSNEDYPPNRSTGTTGEPAYPPESREADHKETDHARGGETRGVMRYVLAASLLLVVLLMAVVLLWGDSNAPQGNAGDSQLNQSEVPAPVSETR